MTTREAVALCIAKGLVQPAKPHTVSESTIRRVKAETRRIEKFGTTKKVRLIVSPK